MLGRTGIRFEPVEHGAERLVEVAVRCLEPVDAFGDRGRRTLDVSAAGAVINVVDDFTS